MRKIIIPKEELQCVSIVVNPNTFEPEPNIIINKDYINKICKDNYVKNIYVDNSYFHKYLEDTKTTNSSYTLLNYKLEIGSFEENINKIGMTDFIDKIIDNMYNFNKGYIFPVVIEVDDKVEEKPETPKEEVYSIRDATRELAYRYVNILSPIRDLDRHLDSQQTSNKHLLKMLITILEDNTLPEDKISRWMGFIQGVMIMKGYVSVSTERDAARPLFHKVYESNGIKIPKSRDL